MKKGGILFLFVFLYSYYVYIPQSFIQQSKNLGISCKKENNRFICLKSNDLTQCLRFKNFLEKNGVDAKISGEEKCKFIDIKNIYSIQVLSTKNLKNAKKEFEKYKNFPYARIENIKGIYTVRVGKSENYKNLKPLLKQIKKIKKDAFIRKSDILKNRIIEANFKLCKKNKLQLSKKKEISKKSNIEIAKKFLNSHQYKKACELYNVIVIFNHSKNILENRNEACYKYYLNLGDKSLNLSQYLKAEKFKTSDALKVRLWYLNLKNFKDNNLSINPLKLDNKSYDFYIKGLLLKGDLEKLKALCKKRKSKLCGNVKIVEKLKTAIYDNNIKELKNILPKINFSTSYQFLAGAEIEINKKNYKKAKNYLIKFLFYQPENLKALDLLMISELKLNNLDKAYNIMKKLETSKYKIEPETEKEILKKIAIKRLNAISNLKEKIAYLNELLKKYPKDYEINLNAAKIYENIDILKADKFYEKIFDKNPAEYISFLYRHKMYDKLINVLNNKNIPNNIKTRYYYLVSKHYFENKDYKKALVFAKKAYEFYKSPKLLSYIGEIYYKLNDCENAILYLKDFAKSEKDKYILGECYFRLNNFKNAKKYFDKIFNTKDEKIKKELIRFYTVIGDFEKVNKLVNTF